MGKGTEEHAPLTLEAGARHALPVVNFCLSLALENTMTRIKKLSSCSLLTILTIALATGCVQQEDKKEEPAPAPPPAAPPPEPARAPLTVDVKAPVTIAMANGTKCLQFSGGSKADLAKAEIATCNGSPAQQFKFQSVPGGYYALASANSDKCLDVSAFGMGDGALVQQYPCNGGLNQNWIIADGGGGNFRLVARHSGKVLDVTGGGTADGTAVSQADWKSAPNQQFKLKGTPLAVAAGEGGKSGKSGADGAGGSSGKKKSRKPKAAQAAAARSTSRPSVCRKRSLDERPSDRDAALPEEALGVDGGHAAGAGGGDRLAVDVVGDVAAGEDARDLGGGRARLHLQVAGGVHVEQAPEQLGVRLVADGDEEAARRHLADRVVARVAQLDAGDAWPRQLAQDLLDDGVGDERDLRVVHARDRA